jgi:hypothetical protein
MSDHPDTVEGALKWADIEKTLDITPSMSSHALQTLAAAYRNARVELDELDAQINMRLKAEGERNELLAALKLGDYLDNSGPALLYFAAALLRRVAPITAKELDRKADAEGAAIRKVEGR